MIEIKRAHAPIVHVGVNHAGKNDIYAERRDATSILISVISVDGVNRLAASMTMDDAAGFGRALVELAEQE